MTTTTRVAAETRFAACLSTPPHHQLLRVEGGDARQFLQGQLSHDMASVTAERACLSSINSPKGRVLATAVVVALEDGYGLLLGGDIAQAMHKRLQMYVLRAKVRLHLDEASPVHGAVGAGAIEALALPDPAQGWQCSRAGESVVVRAPGAVPRWWVIGARTNDVLPFVDNAFAAADIACALPCIGASQSDQHVAQHLGLHTLGAISFDKGCFTGQEVIARIHYRGGVNRIPIRLQSEGSPPAPGSTLLDDSAKAAADVVNAVATDAGCEVLAVYRGREPADILYSNGSALRRLPFQG